MSTMYLVKELDYGDEWVRIEAWSHRDAAVTFAQEGERDRDYWEIQPGDKLNLAVLKDGDPPELEHRYKLDKEYEPSWFVEKRIDDAAAKRAGGEG